jgi:excisionase family DNA binding protein
MLDRQTVSIARAGELVGVSRRTIYNWISDGKVQYVRTAGGSIRIFADTLWRTPPADAGAPSQSEVWSLPQIDRALLRKGA